MLSLVLVPKAPLPPNTQGFPPQPETRRSCCDFGHHMLVAATLQLLSPAVPLRLGVDWDVTAICAVVYKAFSLQLPPLTKVQQAAAFWRPSAPSQRVPSPDSQVPDSPNFLCAGDALQANRGPGVGAGR